jgi:hypothetical protein
MEIHGFEPPHFEEPEPEREPEADGEEGVQAEAQDNGTAAACDSSCDGDQKESNGHSYVVEQKESQPSLSHYILHK